MTKNNALKYGAYSLIAIAVVASFVGYNIFSAEYLDEGSFLTTKTIKPDSAVRIQTTGEDLRLYEFTPETLPHIQCIFVAGTNKGDTFCMLKPNYKAQAIPSTGAEL